MALLLATIAATVAIGAVAWLLSTRLTPVHHYLTASIMVEKAIVSLEERMIGDETIAKMQDIRPPLNDLVNAINSLNHHRDTFDLSADTDSLLFVANWQLSLAQQEGPLSEATIEEGVLHLRRALETEMSLRTVILSDLEKRTQHILLFSAAIAICMLAIMIALVLLMKSRFIQPLQRLREFLQKIEQKEYVSFTDGSIDVSLEPLMRQYNDMVRKLAEQDTENSTRQSVLTSEVYNASRALIEQQFALARAQQQAAAGEISASIAHEIRNPISGMAMALATLKDDLSDPDLVDRVDMIAAELNRVKRLLNNLLDKTKIRPESVNKIQLRPVVESLVQLARYQIPDSILIRTEIPEHTEIYMPESSLRQAILNLILNSAQSLGDVPGEIIISATCNSDDFRIVVQDTGAGLPEKLLQNGIRPYDTQRNNGAGLGLATVRRFAQNHDGTIVLENDKTGGAIVSLVFPKERCIN